MPDVIGLLIEGLCVQQPGAQIFLLYLGHILNDSNNTMALNLIISRYNFKVFRCTAQKFEDLCLKLEVWYLNFN